MLRKEFGYACMILVKNRSILMIEVNLLKKVDHVRLFDLRVMNI